MYNLTRDEVAIKLNISTRSVDRYIRSGKLRAQKEGKIIYINNEDVENLSLGGFSRQQIITKQYIKQNDENFDKQILSKEDNLFIFDKLRQEIKEKDDQINNLSLKIGQMQEIIKNSISLIEFKKSQFLLEEGKNALKNSLDETNGLLDKKNIELKEERTLNVFLIVLLFIFFITIVIIWFIQV